MKKAEETTQKPRFPFLMLGFLGVAIVLVTLAFLIPKKVAQHSLKVAGTPIAQYREKTAETPSPTPSASVSLRIADQAPGSEFRVEEVSGNEIGFVTFVVDEQMLGVSELVIGERFGVEVHTTRALAVGERIYVGFRIDDGNKEFEEDEDVQALNSLGVPVVTSFSITEAGMMVPYEQTPYVQTPYEGTL